MPSDDQNRLNEENPVSRTPDPKSWNAQSGHQVPRFPGANEPRQLPQSPPQIPSNPSQYSSTYPHLPQPPAQPQVLAAQLAARREYEIQRRNLGVMAFLVNIVPFVGGIISIFLIKNFFKTLKVHPEITAGKGWAITASIWAGLSVFVLFASLSQLLLSGPNDSSPAPASTPATIPDSEITDEYDMGSCWTDSATDDSYMLPISCSSAEVDYVISGSNPVEENACLGISDAISTSYYDGSYYCLSSR
jgi:hypothetical protein